MVWELSLTGSKTDLSRLANSFCGPDFFITKDGEQYLLTSPEFEAINDASRIHDRAVLILNLLNGAATVVLGTNTPIGVGGLVDRNADGRTYAYGFIEPIKMNFRSLAVVELVNKLTGTSVTYEPGDLVREWVRVGQKSDSARRVLTLIQNGELDWVGLYRIYEIIKEDLGRESIETRGWATKTDIVSFKRTANHPAAAGLNARHGYQSNDPPKNPVSILDARQLIHRVVKAWFTLRGESGT